MTSRAAAVAFAASALAAAPAMADPAKGQYSNPGGQGIFSAVETDIDDELSFAFAEIDFALGTTSWLSNSSYYGNRNTRYGRHGYQDRYHTRRLTREAVELCKCAVEEEGYRQGFRSVHLDDVENIRQIGPRGFVIRAEFEFDGRRRDFERDVTCTIRRGRVVDIDNLPRTRGRRGYGYNSYGNNNYGYNNYGYNNYGQNSAGVNDYLKGGSTKKKGY